MSTRPRTSRTTCSRSWSRRSTATSPARCPCGLDPARFAQCRARPSARPAPDPVRGGPHDRRGSRAGRLRPLAVFAGGLSSLAAQTSARCSCCVISRVSRRARSPSNRQDRELGARPASPRPRSASGCTAGARRSSRHRRLGGSAQPAAAQIRAAARPESRSAASCREIRASSCDRDGLGERLMLERLPAAGLERHRQRAGHSAGGSPRSSNHAGRPRCRGVVRGPRQKLRGSLPEPRSGNRLASIPKPPEAVECGALPPSTSYIGRSAGNLMSALEEVAQLHASPRPACGSCDRGAIRPS